ncbi:uncharacterized protein EV420DRAFT_1652887 [Desarmillaria tabescens]|uniref:Uncharacterized protein n=1 Tax=Armillaria tabescens TaxID=1929756 RepID=A0AA39MJG0_ARMTA|nr:uncharacterized protein EV420DRAFT_1652887 [Desarmillaria tabescens]KAK0435934.1 hypothetical protein EV420DRAFT_1652887 [Desarmillaria tabescens]
MSTTANLCRLYSCIWTTTGTLDEIHSIDFDLRPVNLTADDLAPSDNPSKMLSYIWKACENGYLDEGDDTQSSSPQTPTVVEHTTIFPSPPPKSSFLSNNWTALDYDEDWAWGDRHFSVVEECMLFFCSGMFNFRTLRNRENLTSSVRSNWLLFWDHLTKLHDHIHALVFFLLTTQLYGFPTTLDSPTRLLSRTGTASTTKCYAYQVDPDGLGYWRGLVDCGGIIAWVSGNSGIYLASPSTSLGDRHARGLSDVQYDRYIQAIFTAHTILAL